jgi:hypothetical protein
MKKVSCKVGSDIIPNVPVKLLSLPRAFQDQLASQQNAREVTIDYSQFITFFITIEDIKDALLFVGKELKQDRFLFNLWY